MGVAKLWQAFDEANAVDHSTLMHLVEKYFHINKQHRGFRLGVDAEGWLVHVNGMKMTHQKGHNAHIRTFMLKVFNLLSRGVLPVLVFDGPGKPSWKGDPHVPAFNHLKPQPTTKRGSGTILTNQVKQLLDLLAVPWFCAKGDAEADLAAMNQRGDIDAVLTDDVDSMLFGANMVLRHNSIALSGNINVSTDMAPHYCQDAPDGLPYDKSTSYRIYERDQINELCGLSRNDLILIGLLQGADYAGTGVAGIQSGTSVPLAKCHLANGQSFGDELITKTMQLWSNPIELEQFLIQWREQLAVELETNASGLIGKKKVKTASNLRQATSWPSFSAIKVYIDPPVKTKQEIGLLNWNKDINIQGLVEYVIETFQYSKEQVEQIFLNNLFQFFIFREIRQTVLAIDNNVPRQLNEWTLPTIQSTNDSIVAKIVDQESSPKTEFVDCYKIELDKMTIGLSTKQALPEQELWPIAAENRDTGRRSRPVNAPTTSNFRHWIPVTLVHAQPLLKTMALDYKQALLNKQEQQRQIQQSKQERKLERDERKRLGLSASPRKRLKQNSTTSQGSMSMTPIKSQSMFTGVSSPIESSVTSSPRRQLDIMEAMSSPDSFWKAIRRPPTPEPVEDDPDDTDDDDDDDFEDAELTRRYNAAKKRRQMGKDNQEDDNDNYRHHHSKISPKTTKKKKNQLKTTSLNFTSKKSGNTMSNGSSSGKNKQRMIDESNNNVISLISSDDDDQTLTRVRRVNCQVDVLVVSDSD
ncbi:hypothetical protein OIO90_005962 [Microbotryomycetes sp. JL221]|nr:hypothetical protein OIO90_005962 [Microbotryomycetes sp. JL221]